MPSHSQYVYSWHALVVVPILAYVAYMGIQGTCSGVNEYVWYALAVMALGALLYHGSKLLKTL